MHLLLVFSQTVFAEIRLFKEKELLQKWHDEDIYFIPSDPSELTSWQGEVLLYKANSCFKIVYNPHSALKKCKIPRLDTLLICVGIPPIC